MSKAKAVRLIDIASTLVFLGFVVWLAIPTRLFFNPSSVQIDGYSVTVTRSFPVAEWVRIPVIRYREVVRPLSGSLPPCIDTAEFRYQDNGKPYGQWEIDGWAARCMTGDFIWRASWSARLFGVIPLRPVELDMVVIQSGARPRR